MRDISQCQEEVPDLRTLESFAELVSTVNRDEEAAGGAAGEEAGEEGAGGVAEGFWAQGTVTWKGEPGMWSSPHLTTRM